jgi:very-short-patch-repair endonuclease
MTVADAERTKLLEANGYRVLRFWNNDVLKNIDGVLQVIQSTITTTPTPIPSPQGGGEE